MPRRTAPASYQVKFWLPCERQSFTTVHRALNSKIAIFMAGARAAAEGRDLRGEVKVEVALIKPDGRISEIR